MPPILLQLLIRQRAVRVYCGDGAGCELRQFFRTEAHGKAGQQPLALIDVCWIETRPINGGQRFDDELHLFRGDVTGPLCGAEEGASRIQWLTKHRDLLPTASAACTRRAAS